MRIEQLWTMIRDWRHCPIVLRQQKDASGGEGIIEKLYRRIGRGYLAIVTTRLGRWVMSDTLANRDGGCLSITGYPYRLV